MGVAAIAGYTFLELLAWGILDQLREDSATSIHSPIVSDLGLARSSPKTARWNSNRSCAQRRHSLDSIEPYSVLGKFSRTPVFTSKASAQTLKALIVHANLNEGYALDSDNQLQFRFSKSAQMPIVSALFVASSACTGMTTKKVWSYTLAELDGMTKVTVQPVWEYPDDYCKTQTQELIWSQPALL